MNLNNIPELQLAAAWRRNDSDLVVCGKCGGTVEYVADYGAPGVGQHWRCSSCHADVTRLGGSFFDAAAGAQIGNDFDDCDCDGPICEHHPELDPDDRFTQSSQGDN